MAARAHGTYAKYTLERCRCVDCRRANNEYARRRRRLKAYGRFPLVSAERAREHIQSLQESGMGLKQIRRVAGMSGKTLMRVVYGKPSARIHKDVERRILAVEPARLADGARVDANFIHAMIDELVAFGIPKARIARALGKKTPAIQLSRSRVTVRNARAVEELHWSVWKASGEFRELCACIPTQSIVEWLERDA